MIVTVTPNTAVDQVYLVADLVPGTTIRAQHVQLSMAGKPTDASWILSQLGTPSLGLGFAAGDVGRWITDKLSAGGVVTRFTQVAGESRRNIVLVDERGGQQTTVTASTLHVSDAHKQALREEYAAALPNASCVVLGGSLPRSVHPSFYADLILLARRARVPVIFDASEPALSAGLEAGPDYVKPNLNELEQWAGRPITGPADALRVGRTLLERYGTSPIISLGAQGGLAVLPDRSYRIPPLQVDVVSAAGAGDGILAGIALEISRGREIEEGLRTGFAIAAAVVLRSGTAECDAADVARFRDLVRLEPFEVGTRGV